MVLDTETSIGVIFCTALK